MWGSGDRTPRSVGSVLRSDTQVRGPSKPLVQLRAAPRWGQGLEGAEGSPFPQGCWVVGRQGGHGARASPRLPHNKARSQGTGAGAFPAPPG